MDQKPRARTQATPFKEKREPQEISARSGRNEEKATALTGSFPRVLVGVLGGSFAGHAKFAFLFSLTAAVHLNNRSRSKNTNTGGEIRALYFSLSAFLVAVVYVNGMRRSLSCFGDSNVLFALCETETEGKRCSWRWDSEWRGKKERLPEREPLD